MPIELDPEERELRALLELLPNLHCAHVVEVGCGDGRLTRRYADLAASVLAFDPDTEEVARAWQSLPAELAQRVTYRVASGKEIELERNSFDLVVFSWSL